MPSERPRLTVYFDSDETKCALEAIAQADDRAASNFVLRLIKQAIAAQASSGIAQQASKGITAPLSQKIKQPTPNTVTQTNDDNGQQ